MYLGRENGKLNAISGRNKERRNGKREREIHEAKKKGKNLNNNLEKR